MRYCSVLCPNAEAHSIGSDYAIRVYIQSTCETKAQLFCVTLLLRDAGQKPIFIRLCGASAISTAKNTPLSSDVA
jgi:hypothetical protein